MLMLVNLWPYVAAPVRPCLSSFWLAGPYLPCKPQQGMQAQASACLSLTLRTECTALLGFKHAYAPVLVLRRSSMELKSCAVNIDNIQF